MSGGFRSRARGNQDPERGEQPSGGFRSRSAGQSGSGDRREQPRGQRRRPEERRDSDRRDARRSRPQGQQDRRRDERRDRRRDNRPPRFRPYAGVDAARSVSFDVLRAVTVDEAFANLVLPKQLAAAGLSGRDAAFATELTYGTLRTQGVLDAVIDSLSSRGVDTLAPEVLVALRMGIYQVLYTRVDAYAAVDTAVNLVKDAGHPRAGGFVNGILRNVVRGGHGLVEDLRPAGELARVAFDHAHPEWIAASFARVLGMQDLPAALEADSARPTVHLAARPGEMGAEELAAMTGGEVGTFSPYAVYLPGGSPGDIEAVRQGMAHVQDEGSQLIARALVEADVDGADAGRWVDLCAGPGGKTALIGALAAIDGARVDAVELQPHRAALVEKACADLPVTVHVADGRVSGLAPGVDRVLVDAPCSGLGALRRRPEARWRKQESDIADLVVLQEELLRAAIRLTRPGGVVVYSTCSPDLRETRGVVDKVLATGAVVEQDAHGFVPGGENLGEELSVQLWPHRHGTDAMFFAVLRVTDPSRV
ncbi:MFS transporter [Corynebacterium sp. 13CS0277]|uniref:RsmB/NOP family class I SAM-dependent RNA methyltransferase n=1 Tax=Corynebacterium sp. 13CS0277 TaxID=2071994 RepID=UPI000D02FBED|nr:transcription antitermination factor NusB [Corynebacterium sp. 13CS0277]PRQ11933.1 MFS transporter [Corynebacterium sp. 13CS0277]